MSDVATIVRALADLAPSGRSQVADQLDVTSGGRPFHWLGVDIEPRTILGIGTPAQLGLAAQLLGVTDNGTNPSDVRGAGRGRITLPPGHRSDVQRLAAVDALHGEEQLLRLGWVWLAGTAEVDGRTQHLLHPLVSVPVTANVSPLQADLAQAGDAELTPLVPGIEGPLLLDDAPVSGFAGWHLTDSVLQDRFPGLGRWVARVVTAAELPSLRVLGPVHEPRSRRTGRELVAVVGLGLYIARDTQAIDLPTTLRNWAGTSEIDRTALAHVVAPELARWDPPRQQASHDPPVVLTDAQREAVRRSRTHPVSVVSGPPGTGKSHAVAAIALDAVAAGQSVLVATQTVHAADVLTGMLARLPGPTPVAFGGGQRTSALAAELTNGLDRAVDRRQLAVGEQAVEAAEERRRWLTGTIRSVLALEQDAERAPGTDALVPHLRAVAPGAFALDADLDELDELAASARQPATGWWARRRRRRAERRLRRALGAGEGAPLGQLVDALGVSRARRAAARLAAEGGTQVGALWDELARADEELALARGALLTDRCRAGAARSTRARTAVHELATALRAGRVRRRDHLRTVDATGLRDALPLWVGTLRDIDDLLPARAGLFDLVVLDEASQIDLPRAAVALLRARRAVVVGDPQQLRHVSFVADVDVDATLARHGLDHLRARLDVRRVSALDAATGVAPALWLDEHFRSVPHLIEFSARRFYPATVHLATRHPANERHDAIDTVVVDGCRDDDGVNPAQVDAAVALVRELDAEGVRSVGLLTPFRAQADALQAAVLDALALEDIRRLDLRVGTVHGFQGAERDVVVLSLALDDASPAGARRFVEDPHLLNVMVTRARHRMIALTSCHQPLDGLLGEWLRHAEEPPGPTPGAPPDDPWVAAVAAELDRAGLPVRVGYPAGRWLVDLVAGEGDDAVALELRVHPAGPGAHVARHLQLRRLGWRVLEVWPTRFDGDAVAAALAVLEDLRDPRP